jgi:hypothetical protein
LQKGGLITINNDPNKFVDALFDKYKSYIKFDTIQNADKVHLISRVNQFSKQVINTENAAAIYTTAQKKYLDSNDFNPITFQIQNQIALNAAMEETIKSLALLSVTDPIQAENFIIDIKEIKYQNETAKNNRLKFSYIRGQKNVSDLDNQTKILYEILITFINRLNN